MIMKEVFLVNHEKGWKNYFKQQDIELSFNRIIIQGMGGMAQGLFASLLIGTIIKTIGSFIPGSAGAFLTGIASYTSQAQGAAMGMAIGYALKCPPYVLFSLATVGIASNSLGGSGGPLAVFVVSCCAIFMGKLVSKRTGVDLLVTPTVTIVSGVLLASLIAPPIGAAASGLGYVIMWTTNLHPFWMGIFNSTIMGIILTLPISSAAICAALGLVGLAGGAATAGCCAHMIGFAVCSYRDNRSNGLLSIGLGTSMLLIPNLFRKPVLWIPPVIASVITGPVATCLFKMTQNGTPISSGMGTCGLVGPIGVVTGWLVPGENAINQGYSAVTPSVFDWIGLVMVCVILPALISYVVCSFMRKKGIIKPGDYKLVG
jgi:uncharacterized membrane protein